MIPRASACAARRSSAVETSRSASARAVATIAAACVRASAVARSRRSRAWPSSSSLAATTSRASSRAIGHATRTSSSIASTCSRGSTQAPDSGSARAVSTSATSSSRVSPTRRSASYAPTIGPPDSTPASALLGQPGRQALLHILWHQPAHVAPVLGDLLDQAGGQEAVQRVRGHEQSLDAGQPVVHLRHLQFVVEVADRAQALDDDRDVVGTAVLDQQPVE